MSYEEIKALVKANPVELDHIFWVVCAMGVEMGEHGQPDWWNQYAKWQDAVKAIRDRALRLYDEFNLSSEQDNWDWIRKIESAAQELSTRRLDGRYSLDLGV